MFNYDNVKSVTVCLSDPTADAAIPIWRVPAEVSKIEILRAWVVPHVTLAAGSANYFQVGLFNGGTSGTAETAMAVQLGTAIVATGTAPGWAVATLYPLVISEGTMTAGQWLVVDYDETGTVAHPFSVHFEYVHGVGA
jgi:hypothetical protein